MRIQRGEKIRVGIATRQIDRALGGTDCTAVTPPGRLICQRTVMKLVRLATHVGSPTAATNDQTANLEQTIGSGDGDRADSKVGGKFSNGRKAMPRGPRAGVEGSFNGCRYFGRIRALDLNS
jgi:hypothetical protein